MKLSAWAKKHGYSYTGAWLKFKRGGLQGAYQLEDGTNKERKIVSFRSEMSSYLVKNSASVEAEMVRKRCEQVVAAGGSFTMNQRALPDGHVSCTFTLMVPVYEN